MRHFDELTAQVVVGKMRSSRAEGEHFSFDETIKAVEPHLALMGDEDTMWDAYVAINMWWHDLGENYSRRGQPDDDLIEDALTFAFRSHA